MRLIYKPDHPDANENGMIDASQLVYDRNDAPYVITDEIPAMRHMGDNKLYTSKAKFRTATREQGCIEIGNETTTLLKPRVPVPLDRAKRRDDIKRALWEVRNGRRS